MAKEYSVKKGGEEHGVFASLSEAKDLAEAELANVYCDGDCLYKTLTDGVTKVTVEENPEDDEEGQAPDPSQENTDEKETGEPEETGESGESKAGTYRLTEKMNVRNRPSDIRGAVVAVLPAGTKVEVTDIVKDWLYLADGTYIYYSGGKFAEKL